MNIRTSKTTFIAPSGEFYGDCVIKADIHFHANNWVVAKTIGRKCPCCSSMQILHSSSKAYKYHAEAMGDYDSNYVEK